MKQPTSRSAQLKRQREEIRARKLRDARRKIAFAKRQRRAQNVHWD